MVKYIRGDDPHDANAIIEPTLPGHNFKRGKVLPPVTRGANGPGGMGQQVDADMIEHGKKLLDEALGN